jgi:hypothetical protein
MSVFLSWPRGPAVPAPGPKQDLLIRDHATCDPLTAVAGQVGQLITRAGVDDEGSAIVVGLEDRVTRSVAAFKCPTPAQYIGDIPIVMGAGP